MSWPTMTTMTLSRFAKLLRKANPKLHLKYRGYGDIVALYGGYSYILRLTKGELNFNGYRLQQPNPDDPLHPIQGKIMKRGRKTIVMLLRSHRWITTKEQVSMLLYGIEKSKS